MKIIPVILSGGSGKRLWPLSRKQRPKQYLTLYSNNSLLQETILRLNGLDDLSDPIIICNTEHRFLVAEQCKQMGITNPSILLEPIGKNTAPAIAAAAFHAIKCLEDAILLVLSADHVIQNVDKFHEAINIAKKQTKKGMLVTFGVIPRDANTQYGYIRSSKANIDGVSKVDEFVEKPNSHMAKSYLEKGNFLWNSGMFMFRAKVLIDELTIHSPDIVKAVKNASDNATLDLDFVRLEKKSFESSPDDSIDYALMEKNKNVVVVPLDAGWSDIGSWAALYNIGEKDNHDNVISGDVITHDINNCYINAKHHLVVTIGVKDLVIIDTSNATLISTKDKTQDINIILEQLDLQNRQEQLIHRKVYRPWGWFDSIEMGVNFQVKRLHVNPGAKLSLQKHHHRAEHWVVVKGTATAISGKDKSILTKGESIYIPMNIKHSLENNTKKPLEIIEVQSGNYLGEDDIVRFEDIYNRDNNEKK